MNTDMQRRALAARDADLALLDLKRVVDEAAQTKRPSRVADEVCHYAEAAPMRCFVVDEGEALEKMHRQANEMPLDSGTATKMTTRIRSKVGKCFRMNKAVHVGA
jgi:hypothetical protein